MKIIQIILLVLLIAACDKVDSGLGHTVISNVTVIDAVSGQRDKQDVVISGTEIIAVGPSGTLNLSGNEKQLDGKGKFLIPGLWDAHVHLTFDQEIFEKMPKLFVANGITKVRDTGGLMEKVLAAREYAKSLGLSAPDVYIAGPLLDGKPAVYTGQRPGFPEIAIELATPEAAIAAVDQLAEADVDLIKAYEMLNGEVFGAIIARADHHGLPVTAHIPLLMDGAGVIQSGIRGMEHLRNLAVTCSADADQLLEARTALIDEEYDKPGSQLRATIHAEQRPIAYQTQSEENCAEIIRLLAKHRVFQTPTLALNLASARPFFTTTEWQKTFEYLPPAVQERYLFAIERRSSQPVSQLYVDKARWDLEMSQKLHRAKVPLMAGTDTPIAYLTPGFSLHLELERLVEAGLTPLEALATATTHPAEFFGLEKQFGIISEGMAADFVLLNANPLEDIRNTTSISAVIHRGEILDRERLDALLVE